MRILVTGGLGFIGSNLIKDLILDQKNILLNIDSISYCSMPEALLDIKKKKNYIFKKINICDYNKLNSLVANFQPNLVFHLAAESHVDNSIINPHNFINSNIIGTFNLLNSCLNSIKNLRNFKFIHISTDEVYGSLENKNSKSFEEASKYLPNSPYSASKASSDLLVRSWHKTYGLPIIISNCVNNFGQWQFPEKLIPVVIASCLTNQKIPIYGNGKNIREWIYVKEHTQSLVELSKIGNIGETYNIGSGYEIDNISLVNKICNYFDKQFPKKTSYHNLKKFIKDRPGHDFRYSVNSNKLYKLLNKKKNNNFDSLLIKTIDWYVNNSKWLLKKLSLNK